MELISHTLFFIFIPATEISGQEQSEVDRNRARWTGTERGGQEQSKVDRNRARWTGTEQGEQEQSGEDRNRAQRDVQQSG